MRKIEIVVVLLTTTMVSYPQQKQYINPEVLPPLSNGYSQAIKVTGDNTYLLPGKPLLMERGKL